MPSKTSNMILTLVATLLLGRTALGEDKGTRLPKSPEIARAIVELHINRIAQLSAAPPEGKALQIILEELAREEAELAKSLSEEDRARVTAEARKLAEAQPQVKDFLAKHVPAIPSKPPTRSSTLATGTRAMADRVGGPCYIVGFIVCHRRCCHKDVGNGVAACVGGVTCQNCWSDSCPP